MSKQPTWNAVTKLVEEMRAQAARESAADPYAAPYMPTVEGAKRMMQRFAREAVDQLPADATDADVEQARATAPAKVIAYLRLRHKQHHGEQGEIARQAQQALATHAQRHRNMRAKRDKQRAHLNPGQRIDQAIARMRLVAAPAAGPIGTQTPASDRDFRPAYTVDAASKAVSIAMRACREIEDLEDACKLRDLDKAA